MAKDLIILNTGMHMTTSVVAKEITTMIVDGRVDPLEAHVALKKMEKVIKDVTSNKEVKESVNLEADKYKERAFSKFGARLVKAPTRTVYDYSECGHPELEAWNRILTQAKAEIKKLEKELRETGEDGREILPLGLPHISYATRRDEMITVYPPQKQQTWGIKVFCDD